MQDTRREFLKKAALLAGGSGMFEALPASIKKAIAIDPEKGSTFRDAEHIVLLMQENRSFDHLFGSLQGVRGFNDPRAIQLPNKNLAWLQTNEKGETYAPFHLDMRGTKATWMGSLPHSWESQVDARNNGRFDQWLIAKRSGHKAYQHMPLTLGHYNRSDLPFYYALADAFTVSDQHFCGSLTATTPNRVLYWTGTLRAEQNGNSPANINNSFISYGSEANYETFPEILEKNGISWEVYQNELSVGVDFDEGGESWLANYTNNPLEWFSQYHVRLHPAHIEYMKKRAVELQKEISNLEKGSEEREKRERLLNQIKEGLQKFTSEAFDKLPEFEKALHWKAFSTNVEDPFYHQVETLKYQEDGEEREMKLPKGDIFHRFRTAVEKDQLPTVSWLIAPQHFSDHPSSPWYGAWYVSEAIDILTKNPEIWKKTIFILTYDENDGYYDHISPFTAPNPEDPQSGKCSTGIDTTVDYVTQSQADALKGKPKDPHRVSPIGLGYRIPFVIASPWSRGGWVNSQVSDNTSVLMFMENFLSKKTGKEIKVQNISEWRRTICGDLTSFFRPYQGEKIAFPATIDRNPFVEDIFNAQFKEEPKNYQQFSPAEIEQLNRDPYGSNLMSKQETGTRPACPLPYQLYTSGFLSPNKETFHLTMKVENGISGSSSQGAPFTVYDLVDFSVRNYAIKKGDKISDIWDTPGNYAFDLYGPNGFFRSFRGGKQDPELHLSCDFERKRFNTKGFTGNVELKILIPKHGSTREIEIKDHAYHNATITKKIDPNKSEVLILDLQKSHGWYDFSVTVKGNDIFERRYAGHVNTGEASTTDPFMGKAKI